MNYIKYTLGIVVVLFFAFIYVNFWSYIHSRKVTGVIIKVERMNLNVALMQQQPDAKMNPQLFSFAIAIKDDSGEIFTASAEDRQWAVAEPGKCAEARLYPYPPWNLDKGGTYYNARLDKLFECQNK